MELYINKRQSNNTAVPSQSNTTALPSSHGALHQQKAIKQYSRALTRWSFTTTKGNLTIQQSNNTAVPSSLGALHQQEAI